MEKIGGVGTKSGLDNRAHKIVRPIPGRATAENQGGQEDGEDQFG